MCIDINDLLFANGLQDKTPMEIKALKDAGELDVQLTASDFEEALRRTKPSVDPEAIPRYEEWERAFANT